MKRVAVIFLLLIVAFSTALFIKVRQQKERLNGPSRGSGIAEGTSVDITPRIPARIAAIHADEGDRVTAGQVLVELDCREQEALLAAAKVGLAAAEVRAEGAKKQVQAALGTASAAAANAGAAGAQRKAVAANESVTVRQAERLQRLRTEGAVTDSDLDRATAGVRQLQEQVSALDNQLEAAKGQARAAHMQAESVRDQAQAATLAIEAAKADLARAEALVSECKLVAPIAGTIEKRSYEPGEVVLPGARVLTVVKLDPIEVTFYLPNRELSAAAPGRKVTIEADAFPGTTFDGEIGSVAKEAEFTPRNVQTREDRDRLVYAVHVRVPNPDGKIRPGMPCEVIIPGTEGGRD